VLLSLVVYGKPELERLHTHGEVSRVDALARAAVRLRLIAGALDAGCTRQEVADALGISRQALDRFIKRRQK